MAPRTAESDSILLAHLTGLCSLSVDPCCSLVDAFSESGGLSICLYMLWTYCTALHCVSTKAASSYLSPSSNSSSLVQCEDGEMAFKCVLKVLDICVRLLRSSADLKEQLVQQHGFHVIAYCLSSLGAEVKRHYLNEEIITLCIHLVHSLGPDARKVSEILFFNSFNLQNRNNLSYRYWSSIGGRDNGSFTRPSLRLPHLGQLLPAHAAILPGASLVPLT